jgi:O-antigen/teichoic acid export membrane protein
VAGRMEQIAISMMIRGPISLVVMAAIVRATGSVFWGALGLTLSRAAVLVAYDMRVSAQHDEERSDSKPSWNGQVHRNLFRMALPLGIVSLLVSLNSNIPRYFIQGSLGERQLGIFSALAFLLSSGNMVVGALGQSAFVRLARHYAAYDFAGFRLLLAKLIGVGVVLGIGGVVVAQVAGKEILTIMYRPEYANDAHLLVWLMMAGAIGYVAQFVGYAMTAARYFTSQVPLVLIVGASSILSSAILVPEHGLMGAIMALLITMTVQTVCSVAILTAGMSRVVIQERAEVAGESF